ncbi:winged helix-turn-helix domain-containing protein [Tuberibacillus sp. Marseille-P3662]|uniref:winged helix-turn-helix domain-containing protein n=1 Tax=Tuberibacillus sp. Marseille-P3662 TaxID=1965358 RepID=UPI000A1C977E|nr:winged helix-turn-helix domain-containing protein [Tuberibacillus sp. Marseille-P3662]
MSDIRIKASQIKEIFFPSSFPGNKAKLKRFYEYYKHLEGYPVIEKIRGNTYRLITYYENYLFYKANYPNTFFECQLKSFNNDIERYLEVLKQLFDGKATSSFADRYDIIQRLTLRGLTANDISKRINVPRPNINQHIYSNDKYKHYRERALVMRVKTTMDAVVSYLKKVNHIKETAETYLLDIVLNGNHYIGFSGSKWRTIVKPILIGISERFKLLNSEKQCQIIKEICRDGWTVLIDEFNTRCDAYLDGDNPFPPDDDQPSMPLH